MSKELFYTAVLYLALVSLFTAIVTAADKIKAKKGAFRVPESTLILLALLGGSVAEYAVMRLIRHKTLHKKFMIGLPFIIIIQLIAVTLVYSRYILH